MSLSRAIRKKFLQTQNYTKNGVFFVVFFVLLYQEITGPDNVNNRILKEAAVPLSDPLCDLFDYSMSKRVCPNIWKEANVSPLYKKDDPSIVSNYRPVSLLSTIGKVMEKIIHKHMFNFFRIIKS